MKKSFLNMDLDDNENTNNENIGSGLKSRKKTIRPKADRKAIARAGEENGFTRTTEPSAVLNVARRGRPSLNQDMVYWRIYLSRNLREELNQLRDEEGRRLSDVIEDMLDAYLKVKTGK